MKTELDFKDSGAWGLMSERISFVLPDWSVPCSTGQMDVWLNRLDIGKARYMEMFNTSHEDFIKMNSDWPLRSWVGLLLEQT